MSADKPHDEARSSKIKTLIINGTIVLGFVASIGFGAITILRYLPTPQTDTYDPIQSHFASLSAGICGTQTISFLSMNEGERLDDGTWAEAFAEFTCGTKPLIHHINIPLPYEAVARLPIGK